ncbi:LysE family translocator [Paracoccus laeviglucosivorans]|uniref:Threonine/homoserine/homoserine lactone efflux protein n=1 Tax=Paracoccus laeviglucosivorans TaxID=1197861 RepID=A0A521CCH5_9RHOB|nr:LysE family translocator [Paracoccus laeviglucosivorans]SMO57123.1 Threonine/homoserine/homoserine lactone efflux protein [Paracoccus laeviglucosivorans]
MSQHIVLALATFALVTSITPGPNNLMLMASGANFGMRRTLPHMLGVALGFGAMVGLVGLGLDQIIARSPLVAQGLKWLSFIYVLWLAWKIARSDAPQGRKGAAARPMTFLAACAFQWVNPKAWMMALGALSAYSAGAGGVIGVALVFTLINLPSVAVWAAMGQGMRGFLQDPLRLRLFNWAMALLLIGSMVPVLRH